MDLGYLNKEWSQLTSKYCNDNLLQDILTEIIKVYTSKNRYYHNIDHISKMLTLAELVQEKVENYDVLRFAIWYHDFVFDVTKSNNEALSSQKAKRSLIQIGVSEMTISEVCQLIEYSNHKVRQEGSCYDFHLFSDLDLWILGQPWNAYDNYARNIRKEYSFFSTVEFNAGRKKVLFNFLNQNRIYKTKSFFNSYENQARSNIINELKRL